LARKGGQETFRSNAGAALCSTSPASARSSPPSGRLRSEAFARLAGVAPLPLPFPDDKTSAQPRRRPRAQPPHTIALHRRQHDPRTRDHVARRLAEGKSAREATRLLKRYLAHHLYRLLQNQEPLMT
jgi:transposase